MDTVGPPASPVVGGAAQCASAGDLMETQGGQESSATELASSSQGEGVRIDVGLGHRAGVDEDKVGDGVGSGAGVDEHKVDDDNRPSRRRTREERRALQYSRKDQTDNLSIYASDVASACGLNPFKRPWELVYKYVYKGFQDLLHMDAENVSVQLVSHEEAVVELIEKSKSVSGKYVSSEVVRVRPPSPLFTSYGYWLPFAFHNRAHIVKLLLPLSKLVGTCNMISITNSLVVKILVNVM